MTRKRPQEGPDLFDLAAGLAEGDGGVTTPAVTHDLFIGWEWHLGSGLIKYRPRCNTCGWRIPGRYERHTDAVEAALDHAWPSWRELPVLEPVPSFSQPDEEWKAAALAVYPKGWLEAGGPVKTLAGDPSLRHRQYGSPWGGFEVAANLIGQPS